MDRKDALMAASGDAMLSVAMAALRLLYTEGGLPAGVDRFPAAVWLIASVLANAAAMLFDEDSDEEQEFFEWLRKVIAERRATLRGQVDA